MAKLTSQARNHLSDSDFAYIDSHGGRHLPIHDASHVRDALSRFNQTHFESASAKATARRKIRAAARKFGVKVTNSSLIESAELQEIVCLEFDPTAAVVNDGIMRVRVPFYRGDTVARPSGWSEPLFFAAEELPGIIAAGTERIREGNLPLTVYARHSHAVTADHLPIGRVAELAQEGRDGYATLEISDAGMGAEVQRLIDQRMLNAVSLRSTPELTLEERKVNGEPMAMPVGMRLAGIDFAPEGPAMATYGLTVLNEAPTVEPHTPTPPDDGDQEDDEHMEITLEAVQARADIVAALTKPHTDRVAALEADLKAKGDELTAKADELKTASGRVVALEAKVAEQEVEGALTELASGFPKPKKARKVLAEVAKDAKSRAEVMVACAPVLLELVAELGASASQQSGNGQGTPPAPPAPTKTPAELLAEALGRSTSGGSGQAGSGDGDGGTNAPRPRGLPLPPE